MRRTRSRTAARAIVVEEGLTNYVFGRAKEQRFFEGAEHVPAELMKLIADWVRGYEVAACPAEVVGERHPAGIRRVPDALRTSVRPEHRRPGASHDHL